MLKPKILRIKTFKFHQNWVSKGSHTLTLSSPSHKTWNREAAISAHTVPRAVPGTQRI